MIRKLQAQRHEGGFTLIELLIVIVVLGILAAIVLFAVGTARDDAIASSCAAEKKTIETAEEAFKAKSGAYTLTLGTGGLVPDFLKVTPTKWVVRAGSTPTNVQLDPAGDCVGVTLPDGTGGGATTTTTAGGPTTTTTLPAALTLSCSVGAGTSANNISCNGGGAPSGQTVTMVVCRVNSFPCSGPNTADTMTDSANGSGQFNEQSDNLSNATYYVRATQGALTSAVVTQVVNLAPTITDEDEESTDNFDFSGQGGVSGASVTVNLCRGNDFTGAGGSCVPVGSGSGAESTSVSTSGGANVGTDGEWGDTATSVDLNCSGTATWYARATSGGITGPSYIFTC